MINKENIPALHEYGDYLVIGSYFQRKMEDIVPVHKTLSETPTQPTPTVEPSTYKPEDFSASPLATGPKPEFMKGVEELLSSTPISDERLREVVSNIVACLGIHTCTDEEAASGDCPCGEAYYGRPDQAIAILRALLKEAGV